VSVKADPFDLGEVKPSSRAPLQPHARATPAPAQRRPGAAVGFGAAVRRAPLKTTVAAFQMDSDEGE